MSGIVGQMLEASALAIKPTSSEHNNKRLPGIARNGPDGSTRAHGDEIAAPDLPQTDDCEKALIASHGYDRECLLLAPCM